MAADLLIYVADEHWNAGLGHRMRFEALREAMADEGYAIERTNDQSAQWVEIDNNGRYALLRRQIVRQRPTALRADNPGVSVTCYPSTLALEMICMGYRVALLAPRNGGEAELMRTIGPLSDAERFDLIDGLGAQRAARDLITRIIYDAR